MKSIEKLFSSTRSKVLFCFVAILFVGALLFVLEKTHVTNLYTKKTVATPDKAQTTSTAATAQDNYSTGNQRDAGNTLAENKGSGGITDKQGVIDSGADTSNPTVSKTGEISVYAPKTNTLVKSGYMVSGASSLPSVSYRLIDTITGVISNGDLVVVNGKFSGNLSFTTNASTGRLDLFATKTDGVEYSNIEIPLRFQ